MSQPHPYQSLQGLPVWKVLEQGIDDLIHNGDLVESTKRDYIVGYLAKLLDSAELLVEPDPAARRLAGPR